MLLYGGRDFSRWTAYSPELDFHFNSIAGSQDGALLASHRARHRAPWRHETWRPRTASWAPLRTQTPYRLLQHCTISELKIWPNFEWNIFLLLGICHADRLRHRARGGDRNWRWQGATGCHGTRGHPIISSQLRSKFIHLFLFILYILGNQFSYI